MKVKVCPRINDCYKIKMIMDKDMLDAQYTQCIREVCQICKEKPHEQT